MDESSKLYTTFLDQRLPRALAPFSAFRLACGLVAPFAGPLLAVMLAVGAAPALSQDLQPETLIGPARVVDGDTLDISGVRVRLEGIDAPERGQRCQQRSWLGLTWRCGRAATRALKTLIDGQQVRCQAQGRDKYRRIIGVCFAGDVELNAAMVRSGNAWAFTKYSTNYVGEEKIARSQKRGIWVAKTQTAWAFRANKWQTSEQVAPSDCPIKGNISPRGRVYHMPWSPWYKRVRINARKGERWFCSEAEAQSAGWRPVGAI